MVIGKLLSLGADVKKTTKEENNDDGKEAFDSVKESGEVRRIIESLGLQDKCEIPMSIKETLDCLDGVEAAQLLQNS